MSNINFTIKAYKSGPNCTRQATIVGCEQVEYDHDQNDGIVMMARGAHGNVGTQTFIIPPNLPKEIPDFNSDLVYKELIIENMAGKTVQRFTYQGTFNEAQRVLNITLDESDPDPQLTVEKAVDAFTELQAAGITLKKSSLSDWFDTCTQGDKSGVIVLVDTSKVLKTGKITVLFLYAKAAFILARIGEFAIDTDLGYPEISEPSICSVDDEWYKNLYLYRIYKNTPMQTREWFVLLLEYIIPAFTEKTPSELNELADLGKPLSQIVSDALSSESYTFPLAVTLPEHLYSHLLNSEALVSKTATEMEAKL